jgi:flavin reductase (DIM6/NTAB) family NADH-FMN oxidoreductase RutF
MKSSVIDIATAPNDDRRRLRHALGRFATGVAILSTCTADGKREGMTVNSFSALSLDPPMVLWSMRHEAASFDSFAAADHFAVSILGADQADLSHHFARPAADKFAGVDHDIGFGGCPLIRGAIATFECRVIERIMMGDHTLFIGTIQSYGIADGQPLVFSAGAYWQTAALDAPDRICAVATGR